MAEEIVEPVVPEVAPELASSTSPQEITPTPETEPVVEATMDRGSEQYAKILSQVNTQASTTDDEVNQDATAVGALEEAEKKVHTLIELAQVKGVAHAVRVAKRMNDLYVLDTMHDELADKLYDGLLAKGLITKE